jgi:hypothetical protein
VPAVAVSRKTIALAAALLAASCQHMRPVRIDEAEALKHLGSPCPNNTMPVDQHVTDHGYDGKWWWCKDTQGRPEGPARYETHDCGGVITVKGDFHLGQRQGRWLRVDRFGETTVEFRNGRREGVCKSPQGTMSYGNGVPDGPFFWSLRECPTDSDLKCPDCPLRMVTGTYAKGVLATGQPVPDGFDCDVVPPMDIAR